MVDELEGLKLPCPLQRSKGSTHERGAPPGSQVKDGYTPTTETKHITSIVTAARSIQAWSSCSHAPYTRN